MTHHDGVLAILAAAFFDLSRIAALGAVLILFLLFQLTRDPLAAVITGAIAAVIFGAQWVTVKRRNAL